MGACEVVLAGEMALTYASIDFMHSISEVVFSVDPNSSRMAGKTCTQKGFAQWLSEHLVPGSANH